MGEMTAPVRARATRREWLIAIVLACGLVTALTFPTVPQLGTAGRLDTGDGRFSIWNVAWVAHALTTDPRHLFDANIFAPHPDTLIYSELNLVAGVLGIPGYVLTGNPLVAHNSAVLLALLAAFMAMWALVRRLTGSFWAGVVSATGYTFSAYTSAHTAEIQLLMIFGFPLAMLAFDRLVERPGLGTSIALGAAMALTGLSCGYYGIFAAAMIGVAVLVWADRRPAYWLAIATAAAATLLFTLPVLRPYLLDRAAQGIARSTNPAELRSYSADWRAYLTSSTWLDSKWLGLMGIGKEVLFPGIVITGFAVIGVAASVRRASTRRAVRGYGAIALMALAASIGPDGGLYSLFAQAIPGMALLRAPARFGVVVIFAVAVLAGFGYASFQQEGDGFRPVENSTDRPLLRPGRRRWFGPAVLAALVAELWVVWPLHAMPPIEAPYHLLASLPRGAVVEFPLNYDRHTFHNETWAMLRSTANWQPLVNGYSDFIPDDFYDIALPINGFPDAASFKIMKARGVRYVVLRVGDYGTYGQALLDRFPPYARDLKLLSNDHDVRLYEIVAWPPGDGANRG